MQLPPPLPEQGDHKALFTWLNVLRAAVQSLRPLQSHNTLTESSRIGTYRQGMPRSTGGDPSQGIVPRWG